MSYPSDISREQFEQIRPLSETARKRTKPRKLDLYEVFNALLYVLKTGCQWRALPKDYPKYVTVHRYFRIWSEADEAGESILEQVLKKPVKSERIRNGRKACTSMVIVDAQSVKNSESAHVKGYDGGKKVSGIKRHVAVDTQGSPHACAVTAANVTDRTGAIDMLRVEKEQLMLVLQPQLSRSKLSHDFLQRHTSRSQSLVSGIRQAS